MSLRRTLPASRPPGRVAIAARRGRRGRAWLPLLVAAALALGCDGDRAALVGRLAELVEAGDYAVGVEPTAASVRFSSPPRVAMVGAAGERRQAVVTAPGRWWWRGTVPARARLSGAVGQLDAPAGGTLRVTVTALLPFERQQLLTTVGGAGWLPVSADLSHLAGRTVELEVDVALSGPAGRVAWAPFEVSSETPEAGSRPNIVVVLVDTLRADHLTAYGAARQTSPNVDSLLVRQGVVVDRAYAQAPWTIPSMAALFAARWPGEIVDRGPAPLPPDVPVLPEVLQELGYETAGFFGNPVLHAGTGFHRGFATVYCSDDPREAMERQHADHLTSLARRWLQSRSRRPFFLYAHYIDPHDPYDNADIVGNRSPFYPEYSGEVAGSWVHGIYLGKMPLRRGADDVRHLKALYDSEIRYFDRYLGGLLAALDPTTRANTLFVLTADHGEELFDHRGWKHGRTLYEEQLRVPLIFRWDGRLPAGTRARGPARLIDVAPTLVAAAGGAAPASWQGRNLLPLLRGRERAAAQEPIYARHLADGPLRAAALAGRWKLVLFDRHAPHTPGDEHQAILYRQEVARLQRVELYDLERDPGERSNQAAARPELVGQLAPVIHAHLGREMPGLRILLSGAPAGAPVEVSVRFTTAPAGWSSYFLGDSDRATLEGDRLRLHLVGESLQKGVVVPASVGAVAEVTVRAAVPVAVRAAGGGDGKTPLAAAALRHRGWPGEGTRAEVLLWLPEPAAGVGEPSAIDPETRRRLEALGYTG